MSNSQTMTVYSNPSCAYSHRTRIALNEKNIDYQIIDIDDDFNPPDDLASSIPTRSFPLLCDKDVVLYDSTIIVEYINERYPIPNLYPTDPARRAKTKLALKRIDDDWYSTLCSSSLKPKHTKLLLEDLIVLSPTFEEMNYFMSDEFSILDCWLAPILWRLPLFNIKLPAKAKALDNYAQRIFARDSFITSLSYFERGLR